jgi:hypothetical protein
MNSNYDGASAQGRRLLALDRANQIRATRAALKRRLRAGELAPTETILRGSSETDTMTVTELLRSQRGWGPKRSSKVLRSVALSDSKTLGSLTARQRTTLVAVLSNGDPTHSPTQTDPIAGRIQSNRDA